MITPNERAVAAVGLLEPITHKEEIESLLNEAQSMYDNAKNKFESQKKQTTKRLENLGKVKVNAWAEGMDTFVTAFGTFKNVEMDRRIDTNMEFIGSDEEPKGILFILCGAVAFPIFFKFRSLPASRLYTWRLVRLIGAIVIAIAIAALL